MWRRGKVVQEADLQSFLQLALCCRELLREGRKNPSARTLNARLHYPKEIQPEDAEVFHVLATLFWGFAGFVVGGAGGVALSVSPAEIGAPIWLCWMAMILGLILPAAGAPLAGRLAWKTLRKV